jgi:hypothetical protein
VRVSKDGCKCSVWFETMCPVQAHTAAERNIFGDPKDRVRAFDGLRVSLNIEDQQACLSQRQLSHNLTGWI